MNILLVEDDPSIRAIIMHHLRSEGHTVAIAMNGRDGLDIAIRNKFEFIVSDMDMPYMTGDQMLHEIKKQHPWVKCVGMSGRSGWGLPEGVPLLLKPFPLNWIAEELEKQNELVKL